MCLFGKKVIIKQDELNDQKGQNPKNENEHALLFDTYVVHISKIYCISCLKTYFYGDVQNVATHKGPFYDHFWSFFCQLHRNLSQNWVPNVNLTCL